MTPYEFVLISAALRGATISELHSACVNYCGAKLSNSPQTYAAVNRLVERGLLVRRNNQAMSTQQGYDALNEYIRTWEAMLAMSEQNLLEVYRDDLPLGTIGPVPTKLGRPRTRPKTRAQEERERDRRENEEAIARDRERARAQRAEREAKASANEGLFSDDWDALIKNANERDSDEADGYPDNAYYND